MTKAHHFYQKAVFLCFCYFFVSVNADELCSLCGKKYPDDCKCSNLDRIERNLLHALSGYSGSVQYDDSSYSPLFGQVSTAVTGQSFQIDVSQYLPIDSNRKAIGLLGDSLWILAKFGSEKKAKDQWHKIVEWINGYEEGSGEWLEAWHNACLFALRRVLGNYHHYINLAQGLIAIGEYDIAESVLTEAEHVGSEKNDFGFLGAVSQWKTTLHTMRSSF